MSYYARSATSSSPNQMYAEHITNVSENAIRFWEDAARYCLDEGTTAVFASIVSAAAQFHDLGKLADANQLVLSGKNPHKSLPIPHQDAGVAHLFGQKKILASLLIYAHHIGLPDLSLLKKPPMRLADQDKREAVDRSLPQLLARHAECGFMECPSFIEKSLSAAIDFRILFSCLTDADHSDAAHASGQNIDVSSSPRLRAAERLEALKAYISSLAPAKSPEEQQRNALRSVFFNACLESATDAPLTECDAPVGTGKTTAVMAHLLRVAEAHQLRRIFVILPFTNIIRQSVEVYRKALVLSGEKPEDVVAELHHRADFEDKQSRQLTALWNAPIVVTTAVAFFETLSSNRPATLRRLHNLPGCAIFLDEAHAMLPTKLLPLAWQWISHTAKNWMCFWTLASGSLNRFWELEEFHVTKQRGEVSERVENILPVSTQAALTNAETARITYRRKAEPLELETLVTWLSTLEGPVLIVLNTVHTAAAVARLAAERFGEGKVLHLSTSLSPRDRETTLDLINVKLSDTKNSDWFLFATSCVEAGVDFSFRTGVRECSSLASLLQLAGRVNRHAKFPDADVWTVTLDANDPNVVINPSWKLSARILTDVFVSGDAISPIHCTEAMKKELRESGAELDELNKAEATRAFKTVEEKFRVIADKTFPTVVDKKIIERIEHFEDVTWRDIQSNCVQIRDRFRERFAVEESVRYPGVYLWKYEYSPFLGYMEGVLNQAQIDKDGMAII